jgi:hypothetical protein
MAQRNWWHKFDESGNTRFGDVAEICNREWEHPSPVPVLSLWNLSCNRLEKTSGRLNQRYFTIITRGLILCLVSNQRLKEAELGCMGLVCRLTNAIPFTTMAGLRCERLGQ